MIGKKQIRLYSVLIASMLLMNPLVGCKKKDNVNQGSSGQEQTAQKPKEQITFKYWTPVHLSSVKIIKDFSESEVYKEKMKRTGINIEFIHPALGQEKEQYQLMIASNDLPDMIQHYGVSYAAGPDQAVKDGIYLRLNELIDKHAPNYKKLRESNKEIEKLTITDQGNIWSFMTINSVDESAWRGPIIRKDLLDQAKLDIPTTIDEWYTALKAFKSQGVEAPLLIPKSGKMPEAQFTGAYGVGEEFYVENGKVKFGPAEPGFKEYITTLNQWYKEGLIDKDFATRDQNAIDAMAVSGKAGAWVGAADVAINPYLLLKKDDPKYELTGAPFPTLKKGDKVKISQKNWLAGGHDVAITRACKYPEEAVKFMDFNYSQEGFMLFCYGIEGVSYKMVNGKPEYTDLMLKNPDNIGFDVLAWKYKLHQGPYLRDYRATAPYSPTVQKARDLWGTAGNEGNIPPVTHSSEESKKFSSVYTDLNTYRAEMIMKFILGVEPISKYDDFVSQLKKRGLDEAVKIKQDAVDRFNAR